ncbi:MAG: electron transfer flavoprotein subunit beta/FixA family protein [Thermoplasmatota archaeon]
MEIIVLVKQVPDTSDVRIDPETNTLVREGVRSILNPYDQFALEEALKLRDARGGTVTVLSMGPPQAGKALRRCLALGADRTVLLSDRKFAGSDTWATSYTLARGIRKIGSFDIVMAGQQAIDGDTGQVGPEVAQLLDLPQATYVESVELENGSIVMRQQMEGGIRILESKPPILIAGMPPPSYVPAIPSIKGILGTRKIGIEVWNAGDIGGDPSEFGLSGSPTQMIRTYSPPPRGHVEMLRGDTGTQVRNLAKRLREIGIVHGEVD